MINVSQNILLSVFYKCADVTIHRFYGFIDTTVVNRNDVIHGVIENIVKNIVSNEDKVWKQMVKYLT